LKNDNDNMNTLGLFFYPNWNFCKISLYPFIISH